MFIQHWILYYIGFALIEAFPINTSVMMIIKSKNQKVFEMSLLKADSFEIFSE